MSRCRREKLKIIFSLDVERSDVVRVGAVEFEKSVISQSVSAAQVLGIIIKKMHQFDMTMEFNENGKIYSADAYLKQVEKSGSWKRPVEVNGLIFRFGQVSSKKYCFLLIEEKTVNENLVWDDWVRPFFAMDSFLQAFVADSEYDFWQNAKDPMEYELAGRDYTGLPMKDNGLPPPLQRMEIDISKNPGRWSLQSGYIEAVGATMWLGESFWKNVNKDKKECIEDTIWVDVELLGDGVVKLVSSQNSFRDESTSDTQNKIRDILYMHA